MRLLTTIAMPLAMVIIFSSGSSADAQMAAGHSFPYPGSAQQRTSAVLLPERLRSALNRPGSPLHRGFNLGLEWNAGLGYGAIYPYPLQNVTGLPRFEEPTYFSKFPPVYYSRRVARPYGVSPFAAHPGVVPVEMRSGVPHAKVVNPYFDKVEPLLKNEEDCPLNQSPEASPNQTKLKRNPYIESVVNREGR